MTLIQLVLWVMKLKSQVNLPNIKSNISAESVRILLAMMSITFVNLRSESGTVEVESCYLSTTSQVKAIAKCFDVWWRSGQLQTW